MVDHAHVARVHDVRALLVFKDGEVFSRALFLHQRVLIPARLGALSAVASRARSCSWKEGICRNSDTHIAPWQKVSSSNSGETFSRMVMISRRLSSRASTTPRRAEVKPALRADVIRNRLLGGDVPLAVRRVFSSQRECAEVCQNQCVRACRVELLKPRRKRGCLIVARHGIDRHMHAHAVLVGKRDCLRQLAQA